MHACMHASFRSTVGSQQQIPHGLAKNRALPVLLELLDGVIDALKVLRLAGGPASHVKSQVPAAGSRNVFLPSRTWQKQGT
jgi:hypothetical protein